MWAAIPLLFDQPVLELVPEPPTEPADLFGYPAPFGEGQGPAGPGTGSYRMNGTGAFRERWGTTYGACHLLLGFYTTSQVEITLGDRYGVALRRQTFSAGFNGDTLVIGTATGAFQYVEAALRDGGIDAETMAMPNIVPLFGTTFTTIGMAVGIGYVLDDAGSFLYFFANEIRSGSASFGSQTYSMRMPVDAEDIHGPLTIAGTDLAFACAAAHIGPFIKRERYIPDTTADKRGRQGQFIGSLRSRALNFGRPTTPLPRIDWGDLPTDSTIPSRFVGAIENMPATETAFTKDDVPWNSNVSSSAADNERLARLRIKLKAGYPLFSPATLLPELVWDATTVGQGNNEYVGYRSDPVTTTQNTVRTFVRQNVFASIGLVEAFTNPTSESFDGIGLTSTYSVGVTVFLRADIDDVPPIEAFSVRRLPFAATLTAGQVEALLAGDELDLGEITIQGIGPA